MAATPSNDLASLLDQTREGAFTLPLSCFLHTASGRPQRQSGILEIRDSIKEHGWLGTPMTVCLVGDAPDGGLTADIADSRQYRIVNGNHRLAALLLLEKERPPDSSPTMITVDVHVGMTVDTERLVASSEFASVSEHFVQKIGLERRVDCIEKELPPSRYGASEYLHLKVGTFT